MLFSFTFDPGLTVYADKRVFPILYLFITRYFKLRYRLHTERCAHLKLTTQCIKQDVFVLGVILIVERRLSRGAWLIHDQLNVLVKISLFYLPLYSITT